MFSALVFGLVIGAVRYQHTTAAEGSSDDMDSEVLSLAWIEKPPYATSPKNDTLDNEVIGMIFEVLLDDCGEGEGIEYQQFKFDSEFTMINFLRQNKVHIALPIFENPDDRRYSEFPFVKVDGYPGTEYITTDDKTKVLSVVMDAVKKSWPLLALTLVLTAIAGVIMWALVSNVVCFLGVSVLFCCIVSLL